VLAGDLNDVRGSQALQILERQWLVTNEGELPTIPVERPVRQIDFVLVRPRERWRLVESRVLSEAVASDHRAILSVLELVR
jgi:endonuclease/exonuclease/phosphatase (EEP) superfamily protein YafD